jgi:hypothetical protein
MLGFIISLFTGPFGKIIDYGMVIVVVLGLGFGYVKLKEYEAVKQATIEYNQKQLAITTQENKDYQIKIDALKESTDKLIEENQKLNDTLQAQADSTTQFLNLSKDKTFDPIFNETLLRMKGKK